MLATSMLTVMMAHTAASSVVSIVLAIYSVSEGDYLNALVYGAVAVAGIIGVCRWWKVTYQVDYVGEKGIARFAGGSGNKVTGESIEFSDKFSKPAYNNQVTIRGWTNDKIADAINNPVKLGNSVNKYTGNSVTLYYVDDIHYVAVDDVTNKVIQIADLRDPFWVMSLFK